MKNNSFICIYIILSILTVGTSVVLALLKITNTTTMSWFFVMLPVFGMITFVAVAFIVAISIYEIKSVCGRKKYITKNIIE